MSPAKKNPKIQESLEWYQAHFVKHCELCGKKMAVHGFRPKGDRGEKRVSAACVTEGCTARRKEVFYLGDHVGEKRVKQKPTYIEKQIITKQIMRWPKVVYSS